MKYISTGQAAKLCSVTPNTVLKWIKSGKLPARRTIGGHYRIPREYLEVLLDELEEEARAQAGGEGFQYCWEYHSQDGQVCDECSQCLVFRAKAKRCFEMNALSEEAGYRGVFCKTSCQDCPYFQQNAGKIEYRE